MYCCLYVYTKKATYKKVHATPPCVHEVQDCARLGDSRSRDVCWSDMYVVCCIGRSPTRTPCRFGASALDDENTPMHKKAARMVHLLL